MTEKYDFHCHSTLSDGSLSPTALVERAHGQGVTFMALTDHDTTAGYVEARTASDRLGIKMVAGIELSVCWTGKSFHVVGLNIDPEYPPIRDATRRLQQIRLERAGKIAAKLEKKRIYGALDWVMKAAGDSMITRSHFADFLVANFHVDSQQEAFDRYLAKDKAAYVSTEWADMVEAIGWIRQSGGVAVLAHPLRYKLTASWMKRMLTEFKNAGGQGIEVITGRCSADEIRLVTSYALQFDLAGSVGSDFHSPELPWVELGRLAALPANVQPVWELFQ